MSALVKQPNAELAIELLADGHDAQSLRKHCGFTSLRAARDFMNEPDTRSAVRELTRERTARLGMKSLIRLESLVDDDNLEPRVAVAAARAGLETAGFLGKDSVLPVKELADLSVAELNVLIDSTRRELEAALRRHAVKGSSDSVRHLCD
jgi:hypothetical protein